MSETEIYIKSQFVKTLEEIVNKFNKEIFNSDKKISLEITEEKEGIFYRDGKIYISSEYLDLDKILEEYIKYNKYKYYKYAYRDAFFKYLLDYIKEVISEIIAKSIYANINIDPKEYEKNKIVYDSLEKIIKKVYKDVYHRQYETIFNNTAEKLFFKEIIKYIKEKNDYVIYKLKNDIFLNMSLVKDVENRIKDIKNQILYLDGIFVEDITKDVYFKFKTNNENVKTVIEEFLNEFPYLTLIKNLGISRILSDISSGNIPVKEYKKIIKKLKEKKDLIETLNYIERKLKKDYENVKNILSKCKNNQPYSYLELNKYEDLYHKNIENINKIKQLFK